MFYCPNCNNTYDIARTSASSQAGGKLNFDFTSSESNNQDMVGGVNVVNLINKILKNEAIVPEDLKDLNINDVTKSIDYKKLKQDEKEKIYNKIQDLFPKEKKKLSGTKPAEDTDDNLAFFVCSNCGYSVKIDDGTRIFSRTSNDISQSYTTGDYSDMLYSNILPRTRKYTCPNKKCESHKDPTKRQAVFFRKNNSYELVYICSACETSF